MKPINMEIASKFHGVYRIAGFFRGHLFSRILRISAIYIIAKIYFVKFLVPRPFRVARPRGCGLVLA